ncbi:MAG: GDP-mannose 4,6-dehydratase [Methylomonas sp.]|nr:GDP-mannose 4,6-dehydratase [Methylomonas sp.]PPD20172.1 MAG: GDP-mannose 4,6-dehydratase [Methylomonas sp.]PPD52389.1 MAG: GDP-mannose 4,6-dehydratase [Methylomonas sp.]
MKSALICGVNGQDGAFLSRYLLNKGYRVFGTSRDAQGRSSNNLIRLGIKDDVHLVTMAPEDFLSVFQAIKFSAPEEIYFLSGQSSVGLSFEQPTETIKSLTLGSLNVLEACRLLDKSIRQYHAGSSECFGDTNGLPATETTPFKPRSPYAVGKSSSFWLVDNYREAYGLYASTGILFNHESPLRPNRFVTQKIIQTAKRIANGSKETLDLGRLDIVRDWGWAPDYVEAMWMILQQPFAEDFVIATGRSFTLEDFVETTFQSLGLEWMQHTRQKTDLMRPTDITSSFSNPSKARERLGWSARLDMHGVIQKMINDDLN